MTPLRSTFAQVSVAVSCGGPDFAEALVDRETGFSTHLTHAGGASPRHPDLEHRRNLYAAILSLACNFGSARTAELTGISADTIDWTIQWYFREETLRAANTAIVNAHHRHPLAGGEVVPRCAAGRRAGPLEGCGGPVGLMVWEDSYSILDVADRLARIVDGEPIAVVFPPEQRAGWRAWLARDRLDRRRVNRDLAGLGDLVGVRR